MDREVGKKTFPIWLLGDSNPKNWQNELTSPLDSRHPARHNIWTPILDEVQDSIYRCCKWRIASRDIFIRNAIGDPSCKPMSQDIRWNEPILSEATYFCDLLKQYQPKILISFGAFAYEFARRAMGFLPHQCFGNWGARTLGNEFRRNIKNFQLDRVNLLPLLHTSISRGRYLESHNYFCDEQDGNYFAYTGQQIAQRILEYRQSLDIWIT